jgi:hypothetical protein
MVTRNSDREEIEMMIRSRTMPRRWWRLVVARLAGAVRGEAGMSTAEYAVDLLLHPVIMDHDRSFSWICKASPPEYI